MRPTSDYTNIVSVTTDCPECGNLNRETRRRCAKRNGMCEGSGKVSQFMPGNEVPGMADKDSEDAE